MTLILHPPNTKLVATLPSFCKSTHALRTYSHICSCWFAGTWFLSRIRIDIAKYTYHMFMWCFFPKNLRCCKVVILDSFLFGMLHAIGCLLAKQIYRSRVTLSYLCSEVHVSIFKRTHFLLKWWEGGTPFVVFLRFVPWDLELLQIWKITLLQSWLN